MRSNNEGQGYDFSFELWDNAGRAHLKRIGEKKYAGENPETCQQHTHAVILIKASAWKDVRGLSRFIVANEGA